MGEKHTHQGHWTSNPGARGSGRPSGSGTGENLRVIAGLGCWCGEENGHDWPGKEDGEPHPR